MSIAAPGRNDPCPCGSGRKFKHCCLPAWAAEDSTRLRLRSAEGRVVDALLRFVAERWAEPIMVHAWEDFWNYDDVPEVLATTPEFDPMFVPWLALGFVPDPDADEADPDWPTQPIGLEWLATTESPHLPPKRRAKKTRSRSVWSGSRRQKPTSRTWIGPTLKPPAGVR